MEETKYFLPTGKAIASPVIVDFIAGLDAYGGSLDTVQGI